ncbi:MAG: copper chaperone Copz family protein [Deltaproteobacteria bacterium]|nr:copper chaperone Copz family protein [Deltaproteobacteria bacterium]
MSKCCSIDPEKKISSNLENCPTCQKKGKKVGLITVFQLVKHPFQKEINRKSQYYFCKEKDCEVVYFSSEINDFLFKKEHLLVKVGQKENTPRHVCYCFDYTDQDILEEIQKTGKSTATQIITQNIKEGLCACEVRNPQGSCCLGNVKEAEKWATEKYKK